MVKGLKKIVLKKKKKERFRAVKMTFMSVFLQSLHVNQVFNKIGTGFTLSK